MNEKENENKVEDGCGNCINYCDCMIRHKDGITICVYFDKEW